MDRINIRFLIKVFNDALTFQLTEVHDDFWTEVTTLLAGSPYTASNGIEITLAGSTNISTLKSGDAISLLNTDLGVTLCEGFTDYVDRDSYFDKLVVAINELIRYNENGGTIPQVCFWCVNYVGIKERFCTWINEVTAAWDKDAHYCSNYNILPGYIQRYEEYAF